VTVDSIERQTYRPDITDWPPALKRCRNGQGAGSYYGCILPRGHDRDVKHVYDDPTWETVAEVEIYCRYTVMCHLCELDVSPGPNGYGTEHDAVARMREHMVEVHPEVKI